MDHSWFPNNSCQLDRAWLLEENNQFLSMHKTLKTMNDNLLRIKKLIDIFSDYRNEIEQRILSSTCKTSECQQISLGLNWVNLMKRKVLDIFFFLKYATSMANATNAHSDKTFNANEDSDVKDNNLSEMQVESAWKLLLSLIFLCLEERNTNKEEFFKSILGALQNTVSAKEEKFLNLSIPSSNSSKKCDIEANVKALADEIKNMIDEVSINFLENASELFIVSDLMPKEYCFLKNAFETDQSTLAQTDSTGVFQNEKQPKKSTLFIQDFLSNQVKSNIANFRKLTVTLENEIDYAYKTVIKVSNENVDLKELLKERDEQLNVSSAQILILTHERDSINKKFAQVENQHNVTLEELNTLHSRFKSVSCDRQSLLEDNLKLKGRKNEENNFYNSLDEENIKLQNMLKKIQTELHQAYNNLYDQTEKTNSISTELGNLESKHESLQREMTTLRNEFQNQKQETKMRIKENEEMKIVIQCKEHEQVTLRKTVQSNEVLKKDFEDQIFHHMYENQKLKRDLMAIKQQENYLKEDLNKCLEKIECITNKKLHFKRRVEHLEEKLESLQILHGKTIAKNNESENIVKCMIFNFKTLFYMYSKNQKEILKLLKANRKESDPFLEIDNNLFGLLSENIDAEPEQLTNFLTSTTHKFELYFDATLQHIVKSDNERKTYINFVSHLAKILNCKEEILLNVNKGEVPKHQFSYQDESVVGRKKSDCFDLHSESLNIVKNLNKLLVKVENVKNSNCSKKKLSKIFGVIKMLSKKVYKYKTLSVTLKKKLNRFHKDFLLLLKVSDLSLIKPLITALIHQTSDRKKDCFSTGLLSYSSIFLKYVNELKTVLCKLIVACDIAIRKRNNDIDTTSNTEKEVYPELLFEEINIIEKSIEKLYSLTNHHKRISKFQLANSLSEQMLSNADKESENHLTTLVFKKHTHIVNSNDVQSNEHLLKVSESNTDYDLKNIYSQLPSCRVAPKDMYSELHPGFTKLKCIIEEKSYLWHIDSVLQTLEDLSLTLYGLENELFLTDDDKSFFKKYFKKVQACISEARYELLFLRQHFDEMEKGGFATLQETYLKKTLNKLDNLIIQENNPDTNVVGFYIYDGKDQQYKNDVLNNTANDSIRSNNYKDIDVSLKRSCNGYLLKCSDESTNHIDLDPITDCDSGISHSNNGSQTTTSRVARTIRTQEATEIIKSVNRPTRYFDETRIHSPLRSPRSDKNKNGNNFEPFVSNHTQNEELVNSVSISPRVSRTQTLTAEHNNNIGEKNCYEMQRIRGRREIMLEINKSDKKLNKEHKNEKMLNESKLLENTREQKYPFWNKKLQGGSFIVKGSPKQEIRETSSTFPKRSVKKSNVTNLVNTGTFFDDFPEDEQVSPFLNNFYVAKKKKNKFLNFYRK
ncbi:coiled-coil domain-containing protein 18 isoform X3 [Hydra vulgaris]|uniref:Coiled-coil domain-containing protein 18 isoform X3 n=1 Tax=Hydra vulgaris TaxID=6087 RepID=A0ABM4CPQ4_HYDVU